MKQTLFNIFSIEIRSFVYNLSSPKDAAGSENHAAVHCYKNSELAKVKRGI
jgi:hypothetical protein